MLWLALFFPELALDLIAQSHPRSHSTPVCILTPENQRIGLCNVPARRCGIRPGDTPAEAYCLAPELLIRPHCPAHQQQALEALAQWAYGICPSIVMVPDDLLLLELSGLNLLYPDLPTLCRQLEQQLLEQGYQLQWATGDTPLAATLLARAGGQTQWPEPTGYAPLLAQLTLGQLGLDIHQIRRLHSMGIDTLRALRQLPRAGLAKRFGPALPAYLDRLTGKRPDPRPRYHPPPTFSCRRILLHDTQTCSGLLFPLQRLLQQLAAFLCQRQQVTDTVTMRLHHRDAPDTRLALRAAAPLSSADEFIQLARLRLERLTLPAPVTEISLTAEHGEPRGAPEEDLFAPASQEADQQQFLSRLSARLGPSQVHRIQVVDDHRPEMAHRRGGAASAPPPQASVRPLWLLPRPQPLSRPFRLLEGPERIATGWWHPPAIRRDYFIARLDDLSLAWIFRDEQGNWHLHGWFG